MKILKSFYNCINNNVPENSQHWELKALLRFLNSTEIYLVQGPKLSVFAKMANGLIGVCVLTSAAQPWQAVHIKKLE